MDTVRFISVEDGKDLIVSFAVVDTEDPAEIESLILLRTPMYERFLQDYERGVWVSFERYPASDERDLLEELLLNKEAAILRLETQLREYELDLREVDQESLSTMCKVLKKMNYDGRVQMSGV